MKLKVIVALICIFFLTMATCPSMGLPLKLDNMPDNMSNIEDILDPIEETENDSLLLTSGPMSNLYTKVALINGSDKQMNLIQRHLDRKLLRPLILFRNVMVYVRNLSFTIEYKQDLKNNSRFSFLTSNATIIRDEDGMIEELLNQTIVVNKKHNITVENMTGFFIFHRIRLINLRAPLFRKLFHPAKFTFIGICEKITYT